MLLYINTILIALKQDHDIILDMEIIYAHFNAERFAVFVYLSLSMFMFYNGIAISV